MEDEDARRDDAAIDRFAAAMKAKMKASREKGRSGWHDPSVCSEAFLAELLVGHLSKTNAGNLIDIATIAMMLHARGASGSTLLEPISRGDLAQPWRPISEAVKGGPAIWAKLRPDISRRENRPDLVRWDGLQVPMIHPGICRGSDGRDLDIGWNIAAPVGHGGFPDDWIEGWVPLRGHARDLFTCQLPRPRMEETMP